MPRNGCRSWPKNNPQLHDRRRRALNRNAVLAGAVLVGLFVTPTLAQQSTTDKVSSPQKAPATARVQSGELLHQARVAMKGGNLELAERYIAQAEKLNSKKDGLLSRFSDTPEKARRELTRLKKNGAKPPATARLKGLLTGQPEKQLESQPAQRLPQEKAAAPTGSVPGTAKLEQRTSQARALMAQAKAAFDRGDLVKAEGLTRQAEARQVPEEAFAGGDTPWELTMRINKQRRMTGVVPASGVKRDSKVTAAVYESLNDNTYVRPAAAADNPQAAPGNSLAQGLNEFPSFEQPAFPTPEAGFPATEQPGTPGTPATTTLPVQDARSPLGLQTVVADVPETPSPESGPAPSNEAATTQGMELIQQGETALRSKDLDAARDLFRQAWVYKDDLDPTVRQRLQDHLQLLRSGATAKQEPAFDQEEASRIQRIISEISREQALIARDLNVAPRSAWERMKQLRQQVNEADLPAETRRSLAGRIDQAVKETEAFIEANRAQIELDEQNRDVLAAIDRERLMRVETQNKLATLVDEFNGMIDQQRYSEAVLIAKQAKQLDPYNAVTESMIVKSRMAERVYLELTMRDRRDDMFAAALDTTHPDTPLAYDERFPIQYPKKWDELVNRREALLADGQSRYNEAEQEIVRALRKKIRVSYNDAPLSEVIAQLSEMTGINVFIDNEGLAAEGVTSDTPVTIDLTQEISLKSVLNLILGQHRLGYLIQDEVLRITSETARAGDVYRKVYYVGDLVIPIPNFMPGYNNGMAGALAQAHAALGYGPGGFAQNQSQSPAPLVLAENAIDDEQKLGTTSALAQISAANMLSGSRNTPQPLGMGGMGGASGADFDTLINLISSTVAPNSWDDVGGPGSMAPFEGNLSLVISNTQEVHDEIVDLLEQLRRLQDLQVTIEVRFITLQDNFFERIGVDFDFDIRDGTGLTQQDLIDANVNNQDDLDVTIGLDPNGNPTLDLDLSFNQNSFGSAIPAFGGFDPAAATTFGFAILSDIEAFFVIEAIQGDQRTNVMQAPKITMFNGQFANINDTSSRPFVTSVIPVVGDFAVAQQPVILVLAEGTQLSVQAVVSNDRRFVRLTMLPLFSQIGDVDTFTFEGRRSSETGSSTETDPDDNSTITSENDQQFTEGTTVQLPTFATTSVSTTVSVPDGGTVLMGGIKRLAEGRNERGMPIMSKLPYLNRLFKNVGIGRETQTLMMMVTPRIIIQEEEEERILGTLTP